MNAPTPPPADATAAALPFPIKAAVAVLWPFLKGALTTWGVSALADVLVKNASQHLSPAERQRLKDVLAEVVAGL